MTPIDLARQSLELAHSTGADHVPVPTRTFEALMERHAEELTAYSLTVSNLTAELERLKALIIKTHAAKGRYHSQLAWCDLYDAVGLPNIGVGNRLAPTKGQR